MDLEILAVLVPALVAAAGGVGWRAARTRGARIETAQAAAQAAFQLAVEAAAAQADRAATAAADASASAREALVVAARTDATTAASRGAQQAAAEAQRAAQATAETAALVADAAREVAANSAPKSPHVVAEHVHDFAESAHLADPATGVQLHHCRVPGCREQLRRPIGTRLRTE